MVWYGTIVTVRICWCKKIPHRASYATLCVTRNASEVMMEMLERGQELDFLNAPPTPPKASPVEQALCDRDL